MSLFYNPSTQDWIGRLKHFTQFLANKILGAVTVTVTPNATGSTHYTYVVVAKTGADSIPTLAAITNGNAANNATDYNTITWSPLAGDNLSPVTYDVYRTQGGAAQGIIASGLTGTSLVDNGLVATVVTAPVRNTTGTMVGNTQQNNFGIISATGAGVLPPQPGSYVITAGGAATVTLALPVATVDDGIVIKVTALTAHAHTITTPASGVNNASHILTFAAVGDQCVLEAYQGYWVTNGVQTAAGIS